MAAGRRVVQNMVTKVHVKGWKAPVIGGWFAVAYDDDGHCEVSPSAMTHRKYAVEEARKLLRERLSELE